jgi:hypothetical protein
MESQDKKLLREAMEALELTDCNFWACEGPTLRPINMVTCARCAMLAKLQKRFGVYEYRGKQKS